LLGSVGGRFPSAGMIKATSPARRDFRPAFIWGDETAPAPDERGSTSMNGSQREVDRQLDGQALLVKQPTR
jgi:hypothetical protein